MAPVVVQVVVICPVLLPPLFVSVLAAVSAGAVHSVASSMVIVTVLDQGHFVPGEFLDLILTS